jgi:Domain of unknown function (DUF5668)
MTNPTEPTPAPGTSRGGTATPPPAPPVTDTPPGWGPDWRRRTRPRREGGSVFFGVVLLLVGGYFLLRDTLHIELPNIGELWPIFLIALGAWILLNARRDDRL